jgi:exodeoxyribonuclease VII small subunit
MATKKMTYKEAKKELEEIVASLEDDSLDVDLLSERVKRATQLIHFCKSKLLKTETEVKTILQEFEKSQQDESDRENANTGGEREEKLSLF